MHSSATGSYQLAADAKGEPIIAICVAHPNQQPSEGSGLDSTSPENFSDEVGLSLKQQPSKSGFDSTSAENFSDEVGVSNNPPMCGPYLIAFWTCRLLRNVMSKARCYFCNLPVIEALGDSTTQPWWVRLCQSRQPNSFMILTAKLLVRSAGSTTNAALRRMTDGKLKRVSSNSVETKVVAFLNGIPQ